MGAVVDAVGSVTDTLFGSGDQTQRVETNLPAASAEEQRLRRQFIEQLEDLVTEQTQFREQQLASAEATQPTELDKQIQDLFRKASIEALSVTKDGKIDPDRLAEAESFVDQTFTAQARETQNRSIQQLEQQIAERAASQGRSATDADALDRLIRARLQSDRDLSLERGSRVAQAALALPQQKLAAGIEGLRGVTAAQQQNAFSPTFLSNLNAQALQNRIALANLQTGGIDRLLKERIAGSGQTTTIPGQDLGLLGNISQIKAGVTDPFGDVAEAKGFAKQLLLSQGGSGQGGGMAGGLGALFSDVALKKDIESNDQVFQEFLDSIDPVTFQYNREDLPKGQRYGILAQDIEDTRIGSEVVKQTPEGKQIQPDVGLLLAVIGHLNKEVKELKKERAK